MTPADDGDLPADPPPPPGPSEGEPSAEPPSEEGLPPEEAAPPAVVVNGRPWRLWAERGVSACVVVAVVLVAAGAVLYDVIAVRTGHEARPWRSELVRELATRPLDDPWVLGFAGAAVAVGLLLLWLAFAPGLRGWLPLARRGSAIHRSGVRAQIAARAGGLPDAHDAQVRVSRHRTRVTVTGAADPAAVERALRAELSRIPLVGPHRLDVRNRPPKPVQPRHPHHKGLQQEPPQ